MNQQDTEPPQIIVHEGWSAAARLGTLGLDLDGMVEIVRIGERARAEATANDPLTAGGFDAYRYRVRGLRDRYGATGWTVARPNGVELAVSPNGTWSILTRAGDAGVGIRGGDPQPKGEIGGGTAALVDGGSPLLFAPEWLQAQHIARPEHETWMFLVYSSAFVVRAELSLGTETDTGRVSRWFERIILPDLDPNDLTTRRVEFKDSDELAPDVPVIRKRSA